jgi:hypothetical protein
MHYEVEQAGAGHEHNPDVGTHAEPERRHVVKVFDADADAVPMSLRFDTLEQARTYVARTPGTLRIVEVTEHGRPQGAEEAPVPPSRMSLRVNPMAAGSLQDLTHSTDAARVGRSWPTGRSGGSLNGMPPEPLIATRAVARDARGPRRDRPSRAEVISGRAPVPVAPGRLP